jgi:hypothetical protein
MGRGNFNRKERKDLRDWKCKSCPDGEGKGLTTDGTDLRGWEVRELGMGELNP